MITIELNNAEKLALIGILQKDNSPESNQIINRIKSATSFYMGLEENKFNFYDCKVLKVTSVKSENPNMPSGVKFEYYSV